MIGNKTEKEDINMINSVAPNQAVNEVQIPEVEQNRQYVSMRGRSDFERTPESDSFESESKNNTGKTVGIIAGVVAAAALVVGGICLHKGGKALEGKDASFKEKLEAGWKELRGKGAEKVEKDAKDNAADSAKEKAEKDAKEQAADSAKEKAENDAKEQAAETKNQKKTKNLTLEEREARAEQWRQNAEDYVKKIESHCNGQRTVNLNPVTDEARAEMLADAKFSKNKLSDYARKYERNEMRKGIDQILNFKEIKDLETLYAFREEVMAFGSPRQKELFLDMESKLKKQAEMKAKTDSLVADIETRLDGSGYLEMGFVPKKRTNFEHKRLQQVYNKEVANELRAREIQARSADILADMEQQLNGNISISVRNTNHAEHKRTQAYYDSLATEIDAHNDRLRMQELQKQNKSLREKLRNLMNSKS